ncbi:MAG: hypothetical protein KDK37_07365, partial [Leptospiraceae bacterium]|nr:hypothetical protein [Leptospiraceae bacterium]
MARNRLTFDESESESRSEDYFPEDRDPVTVYVDDYAPQRKRKRLIWFGGLGLLLIALIVGGFAIYHFFFQNSSNQVATTEGPLDLDSIRDRYYLPTVTDDPTLQKAISHYKDGFRDEANREFEDYLET